MPDQSRHCCCSFGQECMATVIIFDSAIAEWWPKLEGLALAAFPGNWKPEPFHGLPAQAHPLYSQPYPMLDKTCNLGCFLSTVEWKTSWLYLFFLLKNWFGFLVLLWLDWSKYAISPIYIPKTDRSALTGVRIFCLIAFHFTLLCFNYVLRLNKEIVVSCTPWISYKFKGQRKRKGKKTTNTSLFAVVPIMWAVKCTVSFNRNLAWLWLNEEYTEWILPLKTMGF